MDKGSGLAHTVEATAANVHDMSQTASPMTGEEEAVYGDSSYLGALKRKDAIIQNKSGWKIKYRINRRPSQLKKLSRSGQYAAKKAEHAKSSVHTKVDHDSEAVKKAAALSQNTIPRGRKEASQIQYDVRVSESVSV